MTLQPDGMNLWLCLSTYYLCDFIKICVRWSGGRWKLSDQQEKKKTQKLNTRLLDSYTGYWGRQNNDTPKMFMS